MFDNWIWDPVQYNITNYRGSAIAQCVSYNLRTLMNVLYVVSGGGRNGTWRGEFNIVLGIWSGLWRNMERWVYRCMWYMVRAVTKHGQMSWKLYEVSGLRYDRTWRDECTIVCGIWSRVWRDEFNTVRGIWSKVWRNMERWVYHCMWYLVEGVTEYGEMSSTLYEVSCQRYDGTWRDCTWYLVEGVTKHREVSSALYVASGRECEGTLRGDFNIVRGIWSPLWGNIERCVQYCTTICQKTEPPAFILSRDSTHITISRKVKRYMAVRTH